MIIIINVVEDLFFKEKKALRCETVCDITYTYKFFGEKEENMQKIIVMKVQKYYINMLQIMI